MSSTLRAVVLLGLGTVIGMLLVEGSKSLLAEADQPKTAGTTTASISDRDWAATGPGRVEPVSGELRLGAATSGRIAKVLVQENDNVEAGALLAIIDDSEQAARVQSAEADVAFRQAERDRDVKSDVNEERHAAETAVAESERALADKTAERDRSSAGLQAGQKTAENATALSHAIAELESRLADDRNALKMSKALTGSTPPSRTDSALAIATADLAVARANYEKTKIRAPRAGQILQVLKAAGELAGTTADDAVLVLGDVSQLRVRVELNERDAGRVSIGQRAVVRAEAYPDQRFGGGVSRIAAATRPKKQSDSASGAAGAERSVEVLVDLDQPKPLIPGLRVDVYFDDSKSETIGEVNNAGH